MDKILFISSNITGNGHKSITESLYYQIEKINTEVSIQEVDAFELGGIFTITMAKLYNKVAVLTPRLWGSLYKMSNSFTPIINFIAEHSVKRDFLNIVKQVNPKLIVTVHPGFVGSIINILKKNGLNIPVVVIVADFDNITNLWADKRTLYTLCPTKESYDTLVGLGISKDKLKIMGFPTRDAFNHVKYEDVDRSIACTIENKKVNFLIMNGSQGGIFSRRIAEQLLKNFDCSVTILAGKDAILKKSLEAYLEPKYPGRVTVCGFTDKVQSYMSNADMLFVRASPNVLMEAINMCKPIIVTGSFTGQEEKNPQFICKNNLGVKCEDINKLTQVVKELLANGGKKLKEIEKSQLEFRNPNAAKNIAEFITGLL